MNKKLLILSLLALIGFEACRNRSNQSAGENEEKNVIALFSPDFNADSAYTYTKTQVDFGPRIPGTSAHQKCADYLVAKLKSFGAKVSIEGEKTQTYDGKSFQLKNIVAAFNPDKKKRVLITAHWDARPFSDQDTDPANHVKPFDAANDGASGVAVILEMARQIQQKEPNVGVDFVLWDLEDYGKANDETPNETTWCLGSQYWAKKAIASGYKALYGINLDMVGGGSAQFTQDEISRQAAPNVVNQVWDIGNEIGYASYFTKIPSGKLVDDHFWMNKAGVPSIDIIHYNDNSGFYINWHTQLDNLANIDKNTLKATGQTVLETIYREK
ncbi:MULTISPECIES: M28 family peptidase [unclassified Pedobacter]|uniref:M28 family peptidase n=1 Tax=unclassified Pedobacter TaxID=2628915 RepID=UPI00142423A5|nr:MULTISPECIES: M28 family peptidase [unclassified Pedobacter]NII85083.1 Zn-dependent M28 family amino/carboxypeptidase [Pedobacter sp. SG908]NMN38008.1 Zn-dependent M28 family amino/carboxypeptidase [Pedobacter sp. SG918]